MIWLILVIVIAGALVLIGVALARRGAIPEKIAGIFCPACGRAFGQQAKTTEFMRKLDPCPPGSLVSGYEIRCSYCQAESVFTRDGRFVGRGKAKDHLVIPERL